MSGLIDAEEFRKQFFELETEFRPSQIDAVFDCLYNSEILDVDKKERNMRLIDANALIASVDGNPFTTESVKSYMRVSVKAMPTVPSVPAEWWVMLKNSVTETAEMNRGVEENRQCYDYACFVLSMMDVIERRSYGRV